MWKYFQIIIILSIQALKYWYKCLAKLLWTRDSIVQLDVCSSITNLSTQGDDKVVFKCLCH